MTTEKLIRELERLPLNDKLVVIEQTLKSIRLEKEKGLRDAAESLYDDYVSDTQLTEFTNLDNEPFYEAR